jgi:hypothetical protein
MENKSEIDQVLKSYPALRYDMEENALIGKLFIGQFDSYSVKIELNNYPPRLPLIFETDGRIPKLANRHIYTDSGSCCITTDAKAQILLKTKVRGLNAIIEMLVIPYFQNNSYYEIEKKYFTTEYAHDYKGVIESYQDILEITDNYAISLLIRSRVIGNKLKIKDQCYCGSGLPLKKCKAGRHDQCYRNFKCIELDILVNDHQFFVRNESELLKTFKDKLMYVLNTQSLNDLN